MDTKEHREKINGFITDMGIALSDEERKDLNELLYAMNELGLWPDNVDSVSMDQALDSWRAVESIRGRKFPNELKM